MSLFIVLQGIRWCLFANNQNAVSNVRNKVGSEAEHPLEQGRW
jgi:hypothetical protein